EKQDESKATYVKILKKEDGKIDFNKPAINIHNMIRGLLPWPCAYCFLDGKMLKFFSSEPYEKIYNNSSPGQIVEIIKNSGFIVTCYNSSLLIKEVQLEGGKRMSAFDFAIGHKELAGKILK
ncbi:MAG: methionyl-tRNA formyltransferase, partial [Candidatus Goldbacteria bacterium]|nr:methionyl-tRNA formyltransferase [Candidatus Goldiibacteriota bacterium]